MQAVAFFIINRKKVRPKLKYTVIYRHCDEYPVQVMCWFISVSRRVYDDFVNRKGQPKQDKDLDESIRECHRIADKPYVYR